MMKLTMLPRMPSSMLISIAAPVSRSTSGSMTTTETVWRTKPSPSASAIVLGSRAG